MCAHTGGAFDWVSQTTVNTGIEQTPLDPRVLFAGAGLET